MFLVHNSLQISEMRQGGSVPVEWLRKRYMGVTNVWSHPEIIGKSVSA